jgi:monooxygenase
MTLEHFDVLIVGAGLSGIGAACHLQSKSPGKSYAIFEARAASGGTWDLFQYPGVRSDSDMFTLGYSFRPWKEAKAIADGQSIRDYIRDTAREHGVDRKIRYQHRIVRAEWSTKDARWTVEAQRTDTNETVHVTCSFLFLCSGYYRYDEGYTPKFEGTERFRGRIVHPQHWPTDLDYTGKRVVVIGSGATAVTLVPSMAERAAHVTMLQRSPTYIVSLPSRDKIADKLRATLPPSIAHPLLRWKNVLLTTFSYQLSRRRPELMKSLLRKGVLKALPGYDVDTHFKPTYNPWDQRMCLVPDGDLFESIKSGKASVVTDHIETFTEKGLKLKSGAELEADVIVTATGLNLLTLGGVEIAVDGRKIEYSKTISYKGMMLCGVPNFAFALGYTNASWTLKVDLVSDYLCRLLNYMDEHRYRYCAPRPPDPSLPTEPFLDLQSGYVQRGLPDLPRQGTKAPYKLHQNYTRDVMLFKAGRLDDGSMEFAKS